MFQFRRAENYETYEAALPRRKPTIHNKDTSVPEKAGQRRKPQEKKTNNLSSCKTNRKEQKKPLLVLKKNPKPKPE